MLREVHREDRGGPGSGCCWALSGRKEWASADGGVQKVGEGES